MSIIHDIVVTLPSNTEYNVNDYVITNEGAAGVVTGIAASPGREVYIRSFNEVPFNAGQNLRVRRNNLSGSFADPADTAPFNSRHKTGETQTAGRVIVSVDKARYIRDKNSLVQQPKVKLFTIYYPGELFEEGSDYPNNGQDWHPPFPYRFASPVLGLGDNYTIINGGIEYPVIPFTLGNIRMAGDGSIGTTQLSIYNMSEQISDVIQNRNLAGYATGSAVTSVTRSGRTFTGIDRATVPGDSAYSFSIIRQYYNGKFRSPMSYERALETNSTWVPIKKDSRDILGAVIKVQTTYAHYLDYWPEAATITNIPSDGYSAVVDNPSFYNVGDRVYPENSSFDKYVITAINGNTITFNNVFYGSRRAKLIVENEHANPNEGSELILRISQLEGLNDNTATFNLTSWLDYFNRTLVKERYMQNVCRHKYRGKYCGYPGPNGGTIPGTSDLQANTNPITVDNKVGSSPDDDVCNKSLEACRLRNNAHRFGGFLGTRR